MISSTYRYGGIKKWPIKIASQELPEESSKVKKQRRKRNSLFGKKIIKVALLLFLILFLGGAAVGAYWIATAPDIEEDKLNIPFSSALYDENGDQFGDFSSDEKRTQVKFEELPDLLIDAVTATEDVRFLIITE